MDRNAEISSGAKPIDKFAREKVFLAEQSSEGGLKVVPGKKWGFHYPTGTEARSAAISGLLSGSVTPENAVGSLKPDALVYNATDLETQGLSTVAGRVRDASAYVTHYDYPRFAQFVSQMQGTELSPENAQALYDGIAQSRIRKKMLDAYGHTGRKQLEDALRSEAEITAQHAGSLPRVEKVLSALKMSWMAKDGLARSEQRDAVISKLTQDEQALYEQIKDSYQGYVRHGDQTSYDSLVEGVKDSIPKIQQTPQDEMDEDLEQLKEELEEYQDQTVPPGAPGDPAIPPADSDEYHTPPTAPGESQEQAAKKPYFEITPSGTSTQPLTGYYASGRKSYYDVDSKTWSKRKQLSPYSDSLPGTQRQTISGATSKGVRSIPIPNGYGLDMTSLNFTGAQPEIFRDQNGCFYINADGYTKFSIDFLKQDIPFVGPPIAEDIIPIHRGLFSAQTEQALNSVSGNSLEKAEQLRQYLLSQHFYPGDGDLQMAQALQLKLRSESTGDNYVQNLDNSEYLECYSANTLYIAMLRRMGVPSRLVIGDHVQSAKNGKADIDSTTGHAWTEVWDGAAWRRMDATPKPKQQKKQSEDGDSDSSQPADDGGIERANEGEDGEESTQSGQGQPQPGQQGQAGESGKPMPGEQMGEASDQDMSQGQSDLSKAQDFSQQAEQQKKDLDQQIQDTQSFKDLQKLQNEAQTADLFDDMQQEIQDKLDAKEEQMKNELKDNLDQMEQDGFLDEKRREELEKQLDEKSFDQLDRIRQEIERESNLFNQYQDIKEDVTPYVDQWFDYFVERLPRQEEVELDEDSLTRQGAFNRHSVMRPRNLLFGTVKNPRIIKPSIKPKFLASIMVDVSGSMEGEKLQMARKQLVFYNELFSRISDEFGFIRYANNLFSDTIVPIKTYDQDYESPTRYSWPDGKSSTVKVRLMESVRTVGGTNMLPAIQQAAAELNRETFEYPDYASAFYFIGDGQDTSGNSTTVREFLKLTEAESGFGQHMISAIMLGGETQRQELAAIFGDEHTTVAPDFEALIEQSMYKFDDDIEAYLADKTIS